MKFYGNLKYAGKQFGSFVIDKVLGEGRYGLCFLAHSPDGNRVVLKKYKTSSERRGQQTSVNEAIILSKLQDPRIPEFLGVINVKKFYGFVLEYKKGYTVKELLFQHNHRFTNAEVFQIGLQLIQIVEHLHQNNVVHGDIRISNVVVENGKVYLIDFGLARWADDFYPKNLDFSYLGDFLLYLLYSSYEKKERSRVWPWHKELPWNEELALEKEQLLFLKRLLGLEAIYEDIQDIERDFMQAFGILIAYDS